MTDISAAIKDAPGEGFSAANQRDLHLIVIASLVLLACPFLELTPARDGLTFFGHRLPESCMVKRNLDVGCPGCGLTRSFVLVSRADPAAFELHPLGPALFFALVLQIPYRGLRLRRRRRLERQGLVELELRSSQRFWHLFRAGLILALFITWLIRISKLKGLL